MTEKHAMTPAASAQEVLVENHDFLRELIHVALQEILEAEMTEHVGASPTSGPIRAPAGATATSRTP